MEIQSSNQFLNPNQGLTSATAMDVLKMITWTLTQMKKHIHTIQKEEIIQRLQPHAKFFYLNTSRPKGIRDGNVEKGKFIAVQPNSLRIIWHDAILMNIVKGKLQIQKPRIRGKLIEACAIGNTAACDLLVRDIYSDQCSFLPLDLLASSMGKLLRGGLYGLLG